MKQILVGGTNVVDAVLKPSQAQTLESCLPFAPFAFFA